MSGQQIGTVLGGVIGAYFGPAGAQLGMAIGGLVGGVIDPTKIDGPRIGDGQQQSSTDGTPIAWVMGTATVAGTLVQVSERRDVKVKDSGKGGPKVSHHEAHQDFAIQICESSETRNSVIDAVVMVEQDGKIVYDVRDGTGVDHGFVGDPSKYAARVTNAMLNSAKWKQSIDFLYGPETQLPHPTLEAITGIGNTPSYRGACLMVAKDFNVTAAGDRVPQFRFTVASKAAHTPAIELAIQERPFGEIVGRELGKMTWEYYDFPLENDLTEKVRLDSFQTSDTCKVILVPYYDETVVELKKYMGVVSGVIPEMSIPGAWNSGWVTYTPLPGALFPLWQAWWTDQGMSVPDLSVGQIVTPGVIVSAPAGKRITGFRKYTFVFNREGYSDNYSFSISTVKKPAGVSLSYIYEGIYTDGQGNYYRSPFDALPVGGAYVAGSLTLADIVTRICIRGGLTAADIDVADLAGIMVDGYPIARQGNALDMLGPLLQAYFCYASEYDGQIHFKQYGADALVTISDDDLLEATDANDNNVTSAMRSQATEFPRKITASYMDPAQNYMPVTVAAERLAVDVTAIGEQTLAIPVVMPADQAKQAVEKALKVAYATMEGTQEYSVPFAGKSGTYLTLCAGEPVIFRGKRWVLDEAILGNGYLKLSTRYDRQSAYTSNVQAITGNAPRVPSGSYSGPTKLIAMNLPSLRPQDTYGLYLAANSATPFGNWNGCTVQVSYDGKVTWQNATIITEGSTFGTVGANEPTGGEPLTVQVNGDLMTITDAQLAAKANGFVIKHDAGDELGQFKTATEDAVIVDQYNLTGTYRGLGGTDYAAGVAGEAFSMLDAVYFLPVSLDFSGKTIYLRGVGFGESAEDADVISIIYTAKQVIPIVTYDRIDSGGNPRVDSHGNQRVIR